MHTRADCRYWDRTQDCILVQPRTFKVSDVLPSFGSSPAPPTTPFRAHPPCVMMDRSEDFVFRATRASRWRPVIRLLFSFVLVVWVLKTSVVEAFFVPSASMGPTVQPHDYILVPKFFYGLRVPLIANTLFQWDAPARGDIVVFNREDELSTEFDESHENLVKRVIGLPGETVEIKAGKILINGSELSEPYVSAAVPAHNGPRWHSNFGPVIVPAEHVFVLGDNRGESRDSRVWHNPFVKLSKIQGKASMVYWSGANPKRSGTILR